MCDVGTALKVGGAVMQASAQRNDELAYQAATRQSAVANLNNQSAAAQLKLEEENRTALQEAYDLALQNRANEARFLVQAVENGVTGISINEGFMALKNTSARSNIRAHQEHESRLSAHNQNMTALAAQANSRINAAAPQTSQSDVLLAGASEGVSGAHEAGLFDNLKIG